MQDFYQITGCYLGILLLLVISKLKYDLVLVTNTEEEEENHSQTQSHHFNLLSSASTQSFLVKIEKHEGDGWLWRPEFHPHIEEHC